MKSISVVKKILSVLGLVFLAALAVITADITSTLIDKAIIIPAKKENKVSIRKKTLEKKKALIDYKELFDINIFNAAVKDPDFFLKKSEKMSANIDEGAGRLPDAPIDKGVKDIEISNYALYGTIVASPKRFSDATIYNKKSKKFEIYGLKEYNRFIDGLYEIIDITRKSVEIKTSDGSVILEIVEKKDKRTEPPGARSAKRAAVKRRPPSGGQGITRVSDNRFIIDQRLYESLTKDVSSLMTLQRQISFIPKIDANRNPVGFEIRRITPGSLFQQIGLRRGDVVKSINGTVLNAMSVPEALQLLNKMKRETNINLGITRQNQSSTIGYEVR